MDYTTFPENRKHAYEYVKHLPGIIVMKGHRPYERPGTDYEEPIYQESNFYYLTGIEEEDAWFVWDLPNNKAHLFFTVLPEDTKMWMKVEDYEDKCKRIPADYYHKVEELPAFVNDLVSKGNVPIQILEITKESDIRTGCKLDDKVPFCNTELQYFLAEARVRKTPKEIVAMRRACDDTSKAFTAVMKRVRPGMTEIDIEAMWYLFAVRNSGTSGKHCAFLPISSFGPHSSILHHYAEDDVVSKSEDNCLLDAGTTFHFYCADVTRTFPVSGKFSGAHKFVYETVLDAQLSVIGAVKPGVLWADMHTLALQRIATHLLDAHIIRAPAGHPALSVADVLKMDLAAPFMPHGLGHMLGIDTHDVGGYHRGGPVRSTRPSFDRLRANRVLEPGMVITVEPGCYFNPCVVEPFIRDHPELAQYYDMDALKNTYYAVGGVRIEDDVLITPDGCEVLTSAPKTVEAIEALMASGKDLKAPFDE